MKSLIVFIGLFSFAQSFAAIQSPHSISGPEWLQLRAEIEPALLMIQGTNVGSTICEESTGKNYFTLPQDQRSIAVVVSCIQVSTTSDETKSALDVLFPEGTKVKGIYITTRRVGPVVAHGFVCEIIKTKSD